MHGKLLTALALVALCAQPADDDLAKLQGKWQVVASPEKVENDPQLSEDSMTFEKNTVVIHGANGLMNKGTFKLDMAKSPRQIDVTFIEGSDRLKGKSVLGLYELKGDVLKLAVAPPDMARPADFGSTKGTQNMVVRLKRVKK